MGEIKVRIMEDKKDMKEYRKQWFADMEQKLRENQAEEDSLFYYHSSEDRIVLSHAIFWTLTQPQFFKSKIRKEKMVKCRKIEALVPKLMRMVEEEMRV